MFQLSDWLELESSILKSAASVPIRISDAIGGPPLSLS
jgi:hypothetical protein